MQCFPLLNMARLLSNGGTRRAPWNYWNSSTSKCLKMYWMVLERCMVSISKCLDMKNTFHLREGKWLWGHKVLNYKLHSYWVLRCARSIAIERGRIYFSPSPPLGLLLFLIGLESRSQEEAKDEAERTLRKRPRRRLRSCGPPQPIRGRDHRTHSIMSRSKGVKFRRANLSGKAKKDS